MFQPGDFVVYGSSGVCRVIQVGALEGKSADPTRQYYTLQPVFESERIYTPVDSGVFMRPAMTKEQAQAFIRQIPSIGEDLCTERNPATLRIHYEASLQSHQCEELVRLIKGIRHKCRETEKKGRKMGQVDQRYRKKAEGLLHGELAIALGIPLDQVERAYLRIEDVPVGMGCRRVPVGQYFLMAVLRNGGSYKAALTDRTCGDWALEQLHTLVPELRTGWVPGRD